MVYNGSLKNTPANFRRKRVDDKLTIADYDATHMATMSSLVSTGGIVKLANSMILEPVGAGGYPLTSFGTYMKEFFGLEVSHDDMDFSSAVVASRVYPVLHAWLDDYPIP